MDQVSFQEEQSYVPAAAEPTLLFRLVYATGLANDEQGAQRILLGVAAAAFLLACFFFFKQFGGHSNVPLESPDALRASRGFTDPLPPPAR